MRNQLNIQPKVPEINLEDFIRKSKRYWWLYLASVAICLLFSIIYLQRTPPVFKAATTVLLDEQSKGRQLGRSQFFDGVGLIGTEKNIFNEIRILKSSEIIKETLQELDYRISYYTKKGLKRRVQEKAPYTVEIIDHRDQLINTPIEIEFLSSKKFRLTTEANEFKLIRFDKEQVTEFDEKISVSEEHFFGDTLSYPYLNIVISNQSIDTTSRAKHFFTMRSLSDLQGQYRKKLEIEQVDLQSSILELSIEGENQMRLEQFLAQLAEKYLKSKVQDRNEIASRKEVFLSSQLLAISDSLNRAEYNIARFRKNSNAFNLAATGSHALESIQNLESEKSRLDLSLKYYRSLLDYIDDTSSIDKIIAPSVVGIDDPLLNQNLMELKRLTSDKARLIYTKGPQSVDLRILDAQIRDTKNSLIENIKNLISSTELIAQNNLTQITRVQGRISELPGDERQLIGYERKSKLYENLYNYLSQELAKAGIARAENIPDVRVLDKASIVGNGPVAPQKKLILLLGLLGGLIGPTLYVLLIDTTNEPIDSVETVERLTELPIIAKIADDPVARKHPQQISTDWIMQESFRDLDARIKFFHPHQGKTVLAMTSIIPGEGKSYSALNLAIGMAAAGKRILLIDADFRKPRLSQVLGTHKELTFDRYLQTEEDGYEEYIMSHGIYTSLDYLTTKPTDSNPHRLIQNPRFEQLIQSVKSKYDYVILDCPAVGLVSDYLLMAHFIDIHLFVIRQGHSKISFLKDIEQLKNNGKIRHAYLILNGVNRNRMKYGYHGYPGEVQKTNGFLDMSSKNKPKTQVYD